MAKIQEEHIIIRVSRLVREGQEREIVTANMIQALEQVAQELLGDSVVVEAEPAK